ncbi:hypothetical protein BZA77DRAFT_365961 [Pyronema omphalodes]|nr:hypothetical protein BZA77DRAFT_365961 [Pyronema omphalodes]
MTRDKRCGRPEFIILRTLQLLCSLANLALAFRASINGGWEYPLALVIYTISTLWTISVLVHFVYGHLLPLMTVLMEGIMVALMVLSFVPVYLTENITHQTTFPSDYGNSVGINAIMFLVATGLYFLGFLHSFLIFFKTRNDSSGSEYANGRQPIWTSSSENNTNETDIEKKLPGSSLPTKESTKSSDDETVAAGGMPSLELPQAQYLLPNTLTLETPVTHTILGMSQGLGLICMEERPKTAASSKAAIEMSADDKV